MGWQPSADHVMHAFFIAAEIGNELQKRWRRGHKRKQSKKQRDRERAWNDERNTSMMNSTPTSCQSPLRGLKRRSKPCLRCLLRTSLVCMVFLTIGWKCGQKHRNSAGPQAATNRHQPPWMMLCRGCSPSPNPRTCFICNICLGYVVMNDDNIYF